MHQNTYFVIQKLKQILGIGAPHILSDLGASNIYSCDCSAGLVLPRIWIMDVPRSVMGSTHGISGNDDDGSNDERPLGRAMTVEEASGKYKWTFDVASWITVRMDVV